MRNKIQILIPLLLAFLLLLTGCTEAGIADSLDSQSAASVNSELHLVQGDQTADSTDAHNSTPANPDENTLPEDGTYTSKKDVARYLYLYGHLPDNFITKKDAQALGWVSKQGNLDEVAPGKSIGGDRFGNYEGKLPKKNGRKYRECDIDSTGGYRGAKRIVFSNDGLIYYTEDHYQHFELLYGEE